MTYLVDKKTGDSLEYSVAKEKWLIAAKAKARNGEMLISSKPNWNELIRAKKDFNENNIAYFALISGDGRCINTTSNVYTARSWKHAEDEETAQYSQMANSGYIEVVSISKTTIRRFYF